MATCAYPLEEEIPYISHKLIRDFSIVLTLEGGKRELIEVRKITSDTF